MCTCVISNIQKLMFVGYVSGKKINIHIESLRKKS